MARTLGQQNNNASIVKEELDKMNLSFVLGRSDAINVIVENSPESRNDFASNAAFAQRIVPDNIKTVYKFASNERKYATNGTIPYQYFSDGTKNGQFLYVQDDKLYMIVGHPKDNNRTDLIGSRPIGEPFTVKDGSIGETTTGIQYMAINSLPNFDQLSGNYVEVSLIQNEINRLGGAVSESVKVKNICGAGSELRTGNCCLYHSGAGYDSVAGLTYDSGDFYKCLCTKCYRCVEIAEALNMKYVFHKFFGGTGTTGGTGATGPGCIGCDAEDFPTDCGPCGCTVDWNQTSYYKSILNDPNISRTSSAGSNAELLHYHAEYLSGAILSVNVDLAGLTWKQRTLASSYESLAEAGKLYLRLQGGDCEEECIVEISTVYDSGSGRRVINGLKSPVKNGKGYTSVIADEAILKNMFPDWPTTEAMNNRFKFNISPIGGMVANLERVLPLSCLFHVVVTSEKVKDTLPMKEFDWYSIAKLKDQSGSSIYSGHGREQSDYKSLATEFLVSHPTSTFDESVIPLEKEYIVNSEDTTTAGNGSIFESTSINFNVPYNATYIDEDTLRVPFLAAYPEKLIGTTISNVTSLPGDNSAKLHMNIDSIYYRPESSSGTGHYYDPAKTETLLRNAVTINLNQNPANIKTFAFECLWGGSPPGIST